MKKKKCMSMGGSLLAAASNFIPVVGPIVSPIVSVIDQSMDAQKAAKAALPPVQPMAVNTKLFANGGFLNKGFKQYSTGSHADGNDLSVDVNGNASSTSNIAVQGKETSFDVNGKAFVMSDSLTNPLTGKTFNIDSQIVNRKYKKADTINEDRNTLNFEMERLSKVNEMVKGETQPTTQLTEGGFPKLMDPTNPFIGSKLVEPGIPLADGMFANTYKTPAIDISAFPLPNTNEPLIKPPSIQFDNTIGEAVNARTSNDNLVPGQGNTPKVISPEDRNAKIANTVALAMKGIALAKSGIDATKSAEKEPLVLPNYSKSDRALDQMSFDNTALRNSALEASNLMSNVNRGSSSFYSTYQGRQGANYANLGQQLQNADLQEQGNRNNYYNTRGQIENQRAQDTANRTYQNNTDNLQNEAAQRQFVANFFQDLSSVGSELNKYAETQKAIKNNKELANFVNNEAITLINAKNPDFQLAPDIVERLKSGSATMDDLVKATLEISKIKPQ